MTTGDTLQLLNIFATVLAIIFAPIIALRIGEKLRVRSDERRAQVETFSTLLGHRYDVTSAENFRALNMIDAVFIDVPTVREAWTRYYAVLNDPQLNNPAGWATRDQFRRDLLLEMARAAKQDIDSRYPSLLPATARDGRRKLQGYRSDHTN